MARVHHIDKARASKNDRSCYACRKPIVAGDAYKHFTLYRSPRKSYHDGCRIRPGDQTNAKYGPLLNEIDAAYGAIAKWQLADGPDALQDTLTSVGDEARGIAEEYAEAADALEAAGLRMQEAADALEAFADQCDDLDLDREDGEKDDDFEERLRDAAVDVLNEFEEPDLS